MKQHIVSLIILLVVIVGGFFILGQIKVPSADMIELPEVAPEGTVIQYSYDWGFTGGFYMYTFSDGELEVVIQERIDPWEIQVYELSDEEFNEVYQILLDYELDTMQIVDDFAADKGGVGIRVEFSPEEVIDKSATGGDYVIEADQARYDAMAEAIEVWVENKMAAEQAE